MERVINDLTEKLSDHEKEEILNLDDLKKFEMINNHENLDILIDDEDYRIRKAVAEQGYGLEKLINDNDVRGIIRKLLDKKKG